MAAETGGRKKNILEIKSSIKREEKKTRKQKINKIFRKEKIEQLGFGQVLQMEEFKPMKRWWYKC